MPPRKRTNQTKRTPPTSPTISTSHVSGDQHHHLRHTGPSVSTRASVGATPSKPAPAPAQPAPTSEGPPTQKGPREKKTLAEASPTGARRSFTGFVYVSLFLALLLLGWNVYEMVTVLERWKDEVGWWGVVVGDSGGRTRWETLKGWGFGSVWSGGKGGGAEVDKGGDLEGSLNALADALGISPMQVASAVKPLVPKASLTSIASKTGETGGSEAVRILFEDTTRNSRDKESATGIVEEFAERLGKGGAEEDVAGDGVV